METMETEGFRQQEQTQRSVLRYTKRRRTISALLCALWGAAALEMAVQVVGDLSHGPTGLWRQYLGTTGTMILFVGLAVLMGVALLGNLWLLVVRRSAALIANATGIEVIGIVSRRTPWAQVAGMSVIFIGSGVKPRSVFRIDRNDGRRRTLVQLRRIDGGTSAGHRFLSRAEALRRAARE